jgi:putative flippase GtrA
VAGGTGFPLAREWRDWQISVIAKPGAEFLRFGLVGLINTAVDMGVFILAYRGFQLDPLLANALAFLVAVTNSYLLNHFWTFQRADSPVSLSAYSRFLLLNTGGLLIGSLAILLLGRFIMAELAKLAASVLTLLWNYSTSRWLVFNARNP